VAAGEFRRISLWQRPLPPGSCVLEWPACSGLNKSWGMGKWRGRQEKDDDDECEVK
jgi:hypothetical protein